MTDSSSKAISKFNSVTTNFESKVLSVYPVNEPRIEARFDPGNAKLCVGTSFVIGEDWYISSEKMPPRLFPLDKKVLKENASITLKDLKPHLEKLKLNTKIQQEIWPNVFKGTLINSNKKMIYKLPDFFKKIDKLIQDEAEMIRSDGNKKERILYLQNYKKEIEETLKNEKNIVTMKNKHCLKITWFGDFFNHYVFVSDCCPNKDLKRFTYNMSKNKILQIHDTIKTLPWTQFLSENLMKYFVIQIMDLIDYFKKIKIVHGNLTLDNILLTDNFQIKVTDFACSRYYGSDTFKINKYLHEINIENQPPEYFRPDNFVEARDAHKIDIFSLGCCIFTMATNKILFEDKIDPSKNGEKIIENIIEKQKNISAILGENCDLKRSTEFIKFLQKTLEIFEKARITIEELKNLDWIDNNRVNIKKIETTNSNDSYKLLMEYMKSDHISYYNENKTKTQIISPQIQDIKYSHYRINSNTKNNNVTKQNYKKGKNLNFKIKKRPVTIHGKSF